MIVILPPKAPSLALNAFDGSRIFRPQNQSERDCTPEFVLTERVKKLLEGSKDIEKLAATHLHGLGLPIHMADMAVYLASHEAAITTGQIFALSIAAPRSVAANGDDVLTWPANSFTRTARMALSKKPQHLFADMLERVCAATTTVLGPNVDLARVVVEPPKYLNPWRHGNECRNGLGQGCR